ncbi:phosphotransferase family protein [Conexibacter stalactiti]|uniref:Phosphotransferase family protein n=1 Tax=Conexibacter stalactiti TaxID=1940611 RepID=A0ABU4HTE8_9ACTN|nr:phosphotransferase family protein [Conexibacter stalactiti]MDW5596548.1 phosphotransferase family protein [Conexibacter stalactiti]MEC5037190.1 phosphotransferase family protein [Conexibacter stalactiti]
MSGGLAADDVAATWAHAGGPGRRPPLVVLDTLAAFLDAHAIGEPGALLRIAPLGDGHSNVTLTVQRGATRVVLRRPPRGELPPSAHDVLREADILRALAGTGVPVPAVLATSDDRAVIGVPFVVLAEIDGVAIGDAVPAALDDPAQRRRIGLAFVDALAAVHAVDWRATALAGSARPDGYLARQLRRFGALWERQRTRSLPEMEAVATWLERELPPSGPPAIVHGDARLGNALFAVDAPARLVALLDWEMATIGDPLADLGYLCAQWVDPGEPIDGMAALSAVTAQPGFPRRDELVARYAERSGRSLEQLRWYVVLALWKSAVFMEGNYARALAGDSDDPFLRGFGAGVPDLARRALALTEGAVDVTEPAR